MEIRELTPEVSVGPQVGPEDMEALAARGFRTILVNRPDGEVPGQPTFAEVAAAAKKHGLEARHVPVISGDLTQDDVEAFGRALEELPAPVFAYCRSGTRSTTLWALSSLDAMPRAEILKRAAIAGYDMSGVVGPATP